MPGRLRDPGPSVKDAPLDEVLREKGNSKEKLARTATTEARASRSTLGRTGGKSDDCEEWTAADLRRKAAEVGVTGRSRMRKSELISSLRGY